MQKFLISFVVLAALAQIGSGLQCWECTETQKNGENCKDPFMNNTVKTTCLVTQVCVKQATAKINVGNLEIPPLVTRGCGIPCGAVLLEVSSHCSTCNTDLCNSSGIAVPSLVTFVVLLVSQCLNL